MSRARLKRVWLVGGETGGHVVPLLAVAEKLKSISGITIEFVGSRHGIEARLARQANFRFIAVQSGKLRRSGSLLSGLLNVFDGIKIIIGVMQTVWHIQHLRPKVIFSKGGPVSLPVVVAAWLCRVPVVTHESDIVMGYANRIIARIAAKVLTGFPSINYPYVAASKLVYVGIPLRREFCIKRAPAKLPRPMVLVTGGSQGAASVGEVVLAILPRLLRHANVMHICGDSLVTKCQQVKASLEPQIRDYYAYVAYTDNIADYIREASVVVTRAGSQLFEIASLKKAMIMIPLPWSANNHQVKNANYFASQSAGLLLLQSNLTPQVLYETISSVLSDSIIRHSLEKNAYKFNSCQSASHVCDVLLTFL